VSEEEERSPAADSELISTSSEPSHDLSQGGQEAVTADLVSVDRQGNVTIE